jgi:hypothetical protein
MAKAVGFGGIFLKARDPKSLASWYVEHLGIPEGPGGLSFDGPTSTGQPCSRISPPIQSISETPASPRW